MTLESGITFFIAIFIFGITPGPGTFAILARSLVHGAKSCFYLTLGMTISDIAYLIMACLGLATIAATWEELFIVIRFVGAAYLIYLGWKMWTSPLPKNLEPENNSVQNRTQNNDTHSIIASFTQGFLISASNPKVIIFYIAFLPSFMDVTALAQNDIILACVLTLFALMLGLNLIALGASQARRYLTSQRSIKNLNRSAGSVMMGAGVYIGVRG